LARILIVNEEFVNIVFDSYNIVIMANESKIPKLGEILRIQRLAMNLTIHQLAEEAKIPLSHLSNLENGTRYPSKRVFYRLAVPLGFEESELLSLANYQPLPSKEEKELENFGYVFCS
jgi:transcriptional regulator with XRE-family HTH domain